MARWQQPRRQAVTGPPTIQRSAGSSQPGCVLPASLRAPSMESRSTRFSSVCGSGRALATGAVVCCGLLALWIWRASTLAPEDDFLRAWAGLRRGDLEIVADVAARLEQRSSSRPAAQILDAALLLAGGDPRAALSALPRDPIAAPFELYRLLVAGQCYYRLGRLDRAWQAFRAAARRDAQHPDVLRWLAATYFDLGSYDVALPLLKRLAECEPTDFAPWRLMGIMYLDFEKYGAAAEAFREALKRNPPPAIADELRLDLARSLIRQNDYRTADEVLRQCRRSPERTILQCEVQWATGQADAAVTRLRRTLAENPELPQAWRLLGRIAIQQGDWDEAATAFEQFVQLEPFEPDGYYNLARIAAQRGDRQKSEQLQRRFEELQRWRRRLTELNTRASREPDNAELRERLAEICHKLGKPDLAEMWQRAAAAVRNGTVPASDAADDASPDDAAGAPSR
ncbi:MAG: tetratricopeptide repeat protein [Planctomycetota bacterium]|nr:MAG: tetratricopeptide repeat protein [Planctomycetota bacterium]